jgi:hypothetical protein
MPCDRRLWRLPHAALTPTALLILLLLGGGCQPQPAVPGAGPATAPPPPWPDYDYAIEGAEVYGLDPQATQIDVVVRRDGPLARFGHDHVIAVRDAEGFLMLAEPETGSRADLRFAVLRLEVDEPEARQRHGLDAGPDATDIAGTRDNLLQHVLDAQTWPWVTLSLSEFERVDEHWSAMVVIDINGQRYKARQPFRMRSDHGVALVEGFLVLRQTELGLQPFATLGGGLRVADSFEIHFRLQGVDNRSSQPQPQSRR